MSDNVYDESIDGPVEVPTEGDPADGAAPDLDDIEEDLPTQEIEMPAEFDDGSDNS